jgi:hypothetical protein
MNVLHGDLYSYFFILKSTEYYSRLQTLSTVYNYLIGLGLCRKIHNSKHVQNFKESLIGKNVFNYIFFLEWFIVSRGINTSEVSVLFKAVLHSTKIPSTKVGFFQNIYCHRQFRDVLWHLLFGASVATTSEHAHRRLTTEDVSGS